MKLILEIWQGPLSCFVVFIFLAALSWACDELKRKKNNE